MTATIDLVFGADALAPPLTGIGRYSFELAQRLEQDPRIASVRYFSLGHWLDAPLQAVQQASGQAPANPPSEGAAAAPPAPLLARARARLARNPAAVRAYRLLMPPLQRWRLRHCGNALFHAPNFFVPPFPGKTVATVHDLSHLRHPQFHPPARVQYMNAALPPSLRRTDHVIVISEATRQEFLHFFPWFASERISVTPLAADPAFHPHSDAQWRAALSAATGLPRLRMRGYTLYVGTVEPRKNLDRLLRAYTRLPEALRREYPLLIVGSQGWHSQHTHAAMRNAQAQGWLHYLSFAPQAWLPALYAGAALFLYPSLYEGFGLPVVEAMASGTPVITSSASSMPEVAGDAAWLVDPMDEEALGHAITQALQDIAWQQTARQAGLHRAAGFSWDHCAQQTLQIYQRICN